MKSIKIGSSKLMAVSNTWNQKIKQIQDSMKNADRDRAIVKEKLREFNKELNSNFYKSIPLPPPIFKTEKQSKKGLI